MLAAAKYLQAGICSLRDVPPISQLRDKIGFYGEEEKQKGICLAGVLRMQR